MSINYSEIFSKELIDKTNKMTFEEMEKHFLRFYNMCFNLYYGRLFENENRNKENR